VNRREVLVGIGSAVAVLLFPSPVWAHHRPGHAGGPPRRKVTVDSADVFVDDPKVQVDG
jgi:hypothetical protein